MDKNLEILIELVNSQVQVLVNKGYGIYDADNRDYFISGIRYDNQEDKLMFETVRDASKVEGEE